MLGGPTRPYVRAAGGGRVRDAPRPMAAATATAAPHAKPPDHMRAHGSIGPAGLATSCRPTRAAAVLKQLADVLRRCRSARALVGCIAARCRAPRCGDLEVAVNFRQIHGDTRLVSLASAPRRNGRFLACGDPMAAIACDGPTGCGCRMTSANFSKTTPACIRVTPLVWRKA